MSGAQSKHSATQQSGVISKDLHNLILTQQEMTHQIGALAAKIGTLAEKVGELAQDITKNDNKIEELSKELVQLSVSRQTWGSMIKDYLPIVLSVAAILVVM